MALRELDRALTGYIGDFARLMAKAKARRDFFYTSIFDLYLKEGVLANSEPYTRKEEDYLLKVFRHLTQAPKQKACFYNAQTIALGEDLLYAEGQVLHSELPIPIEHGWNLLPSGKAVDVTLRKRGQPDTCDPRKLLERARRNQANAYLGLPIPAEEVRLSWAKTHMSLMLIEQRDVIGRILEQGYPVEWRGGLQKFAGPAQLGDGLIMGSSAGFSVEPSQSEQGAFFPSHEKNTAEPSPLELGDRWEGSSGKYAGAPSPRGISVIGASKKTVARPSRWLSGPTPEEEWLDLPERQEGPKDSTRSPFEGDIPPWAQTGYAGVFPLAGKVFYVTAYVGSGREKLKRSPAPSKSPVLGAARPVKDVGQMPAGKQFGTQFMFYPLAAIPVRYEDFYETGPVFKYLEELIAELGVFGKILLEPSFPDPAAREVRLNTGRWFPVDMKAPMYGGITYLNAYSVNRLYGGAEEGGWWYDTGIPVASVPLREEDPAAGVEWSKYLTEKAGWTSQHDRGSILGHDDFAIYPEDQFAAPFPTETPRYQ